MKYSLLFLIFVTIFSSAAGNSVSESSVDMSFYGELIELPACSINNGEVIDVAFGNNIQLKDIDGVNYKTEIGYQIACEDNLGGYDLVLKLAADPAEFDSSLIKTDLKNLGIKVYQDNKAFPPGETVSIDKNHPPRLEAVPVKNAGEDPAEGGFVAWATLSAQYQ